MTLKTRLVSCVLACAAVVGITSTANAQVQYGVVGSGIHMQFGPQDTNGTYLGIASESYDPWVDPGQWETVLPTIGVSTSPNPRDYRDDGTAAEGYVLLALNPYTGEVWTDIPVAHRAYNADSTPNTSTYTGHAGNTVISGPSGLADDPGTPDVDESLLYSDVVTNLTPSSTGYANDCIYFTAELWEEGQYQFGGFAGTSSDGGILVDNTYYTPADPLLMSVGQTVEATGSQPFSTEVIGPIGTAYIDLGQWSGGWGSTVGTYGFEMDGIKGWLRADFAGNRTGVRLTEYYFDVSIGRLGDFTDSLGGLPDDMINAYDIDALADAILNGGDVATFDLVIDGVLDSLDMDMLIEMLVDTTIVDAGEDYGFVTGSFYGDFNLDGTVNLLDLNKLTANYNGTGGWTLGDANGDGSIALLDLNKLTANYNSTVVVPEPATMTLLALGAVALIRRKK
jgi:hypothetical protein